MPILFYSPGACSMASHIALEETGEPYEARATPLSANAQKAPDYLRVNPRGKVPALVTDDGRVITENTAILAYIGMTYSKSGMYPTDPVEQAHCISQAAWFSNTPHISQRSMIRPYRFVSNEAYHEDVKQKGKSNYWENAKEIDGLLKDKKWIMGGDYTVVDPYALVFYGWGVRAGLPMHELKDYDRFKNQMLERRAVRTVLAREQNPYIKDKAA